MGEVHVRSIEADGKISGAMLLASVCHGCSSSLPPMVAPPLAQISAKALGDSLCLLIVVACPNLGHCRSLGGEPPRVVLAPSRCPCEGVKGRT
jgi:hypothetical protein